MISLYKWVWHLVFIWVENIKTIRWNHTNWRVLLQYSNHSVSHTYCSNSSELLNYLKVSSVFWESYFLPHYRMKKEPVRASSSLWQYFFSKGFLDTLFSSWLPGLFLTSLQRCISVPIVVSKAWSHTPRCCDLTFDCLQCQIKCLNCKLPRGFQNLHYAFLKGYTLRWDHVSCFNL